MNEISLVVGNSTAQLSIDFEKTEKVNTPIPSSFELLNISAGFGVVILNLIVLKILTDGGPVKAKKFVGMPSTTHSKSNAGSLRTTFQKEGQPAQ